MGRRARRLLRGRDLRRGRLIDTWRRGEASASSLGDQVPFTRQAVSKHLVVLEEAGLIGRRKQGREILFRVDAGRLDQATRGTIGGHVGTDRWLELQPVGPSPPHHLVVGDEDALDRSAICAASGLAEQVRRWRNRRPTSSTSPPWSTSSRLPTP